jgi:2-C-methyl-D-erythritol 4-phosphate cytidylyltransferase
VRVGAIVAAAGRGERLGADVAKALVSVGGEPLVVHACRSLRAAGVSVVVVAAPPALVGTIAELVPDADVVAGGDTRVASVRCGLAALPDDVDTVLVHDAARGLMPVEVIRAVVSAVQAGADAVVPVLPVADTVKEVDATGRVLRTVARDALRAVQTPQGFRRDVLAAAHKTASASASAAEAEAEATDDAALVEASGRTVVTVPGSPYGMKVTTAFDLAIVEALLEQRVSR